MASYLSLVPLHLVRRAGFSDDADTRHREVMSIFGGLEGSEPRRENGILFRMEIIPGQAPAYLVRSKVLPENLPSGAPAPKIEPERILKSGTLVNFRVALNAVRRQADKKMCAVPADLGTESSSEGSELLSWVSQKLSSILTDIELINHQREVVGADRRGTRSGVHKVIQVDVFDGVARVVDGQALADALKDGIGRGKAYGCGLLTVQALR